ncbi:MAG TPA: hypothetical protein VK149_03520 [Sideroxyarcus sp.]|nr:hypothetical protein [Sideroxyarcus sp.]
MSDTPNQHIGIDISASADGVAPGVEKAGQEFDKLEQATSKVEKRYQAATEAGDRLSSSTNRTAQQFASLGKQVVSGETERIPSTLARIAMGFGPIGIGLGAVAAAVAAGVWAWNEWGDSAEKASKKAQDELKKAEEAADRAKHKTRQEQIQDKELHIQSLRGEIGYIDQVITKYDQMRRADPSQNKEMADRMAEQARIRGAKLREIENEQRNIQDLRQPDIKSGQKHSDDTEAVIARAQEKYDRLAVMDGSYYDTAENRIGRKLSMDLETMDREYQANVDKVGKNSTLEQLHNQSKLERTRLYEQELDALRSETELKEEESRQRKMRSDLSVANFSKLLRQGDYTDAMTMAERMTAGLAQKSRAAFEVNKAASLAKTVVSGYQMIQQAATDGSSWGGYWGAIAEGALAAAWVAANLDAINSTQFGGGGSVSVPSGGGVPSQATSPGLPVTQTPEQPGLTVNIYNNGTFVDAQAFVDQTVIPQIKDAVNNSDVLIIDPRSRQAQVLGVQ